jgi:excisionase family DNA binding protein
MTESMMTAADVAELLGLSTSTILDWFEAGKLPGFKLGGRAVRFRRSEVDDWIENGRRSPQERFGGQGSAKAASGPSETPWVGFAELRRRVAISRDAAVDVEPGE